MLFQGVHQLQSDLDVFTSHGLGAVNRGKVVHHALAGDVVQIHVSEQFAVFAFGDILVVEFVENGLAHLVVGANEEFAKSGIALGVFGQIALIAAVKIVLEIQFDRGFIGHHAFQGFHLYLVREALQGNGNQHCHDANELNDMVLTFIHIDNFCKNKQILVTFVTLKNGNT